MEKERKGPYVYQPHPVSKGEYIFAIDGLGIRNETTVDGLTREEATEILKILQRTRGAVEAT